MRLPVVVSLVLLLPTGTPGTLSAEGSTCALLANQTPLHPHWPL